MITFRRFTLPALAALALVGVVAMPGTAHAWWRGGPYVGFGFFPPVVVAPPPVYYPPPPVYYAPPPVYAPAPAYSPAQAGQGCYAGAYVCPLEHATPVGAPCSCPANNGRVSGQVN
jgi:hypothetical protein